MLEVQRLVQDGGKESPTPLCDIDVERLRFSLLGAARGVAQWPPAPNSI